MKRVLIPLSCLLLVIGLRQSANAQDTADRMSEKTFAGLKFRSIGPALMSGRIADIAIHPDDDNVWYVAVGSGGVWRTKNAGTTWKPIFDGQSVYSTGCVAIDPSNPHVVWVGTGENVGGRHVGYGDGIYKSENGGASWKNMGLKESYHISEIVIHPDDSNVMWVAAQGNLWAQGGERGLYRSTDGGQSWTRTLGDDEWVGVTDIAIDPRNPNRLYAATWERHRNVAAYVGGGPGTGIHRSEDGGQTWTEFKTGLPDSDMGKIGLAISPLRPDVVYAAIELERRTGGVYRSTDRGATWEKRSDAVAGATGPHYYQELYASPHAFDRLYLVDVRMQVSDDGGKTFRRMKEEHKHSDNHAIAFRADDPDYLLVGTDGGIYESFDLAENWRYVANLPLTQFYKVALDDAEPFYNVYGGTQDNNTQGGPSRTDNVHGIRNADWFITLGGDGHQPATEPGNPSIVYSQSQQGFLARIDVTTGEYVYIQPQPEAGEDYERYNWDSPILVSPHSPTRLYFGSQRLWRSDDRGDSWAPISGDLTRDQERIELPIHGQTWSWDSPWDMGAMSNYNTITSVSESPLEEGLIYVGTDDGLVQITEDGGENWRSLEVGRMPGVPATAFVNDIKADLHDVNTVYVALDNHKFGDLAPYVLKSTDRGRTWSSIRANIPDRTLVWRLVQDHEKPELLFLATEFGVYFSIDAGAKWVKLTGGVPTISFRDLAIQKRENDLVGASFGRSFYVLDDYSPLRHVSSDQLASDATLFPVRKAWWYVPRRLMGGGEKASQGASYFTAPNPPFGAVFTYYLNDSLTTERAARQAAEKAARNAGAEVTFPGWEAVEAERRQEEPRIWLTVEDTDGNVVRRISGPASSGFHRVAWDLRYASVSAIQAGSEPPENEPTGFLAAPGTYTVTLTSQVDSLIAELVGPVSFEVVPMREGALQGATPSEMAGFWRRVEALQRETTSASIALSQALERVESLQRALNRTPAAPGALDAQLFGVRATLLELDGRLNGNRSKRQVGEKTNPTILSRLSRARGSSQSTYGPTATHLRNLEIADTEFDVYKAEFERVRNEELPALEAALRAAGAPIVE